MKIFGIKIITAKRWDLIVKRVAECGQIYRKYEDDSYHTANRKVLVPLNELNHICLVENLMWDEVREENQQDNTR